MSSPAVTKPFRLQYIASLSGQRKRFFASSVLEPVQQHPSLKKTLERLSQDIQHGDSSARSSVFLPAFKSALPIIIEMIALHFTSALCVLAGVWLGEKYLDQSVGLTTALVLCGFIIFFELIRERLFFNQLFLQGTMARVVQLSLFARVNKKLHSIDPDAGDDFSKGNLKVLIGSDIENVEDFIAGMLWIWLPALMMLMVLGPYVIYKLGVLGAAGIMTCFAQVLLAAGLAVLVERLQTKKQLQEDQLTTRVGEWVRNIRLIRFLGWQDAMGTKINDSVKGMTYWTVVKHVLNCISFGLSSNSWLIIVFILLALATYLGAPIEPKVFFPSLWALTFIANYFEHTPWTLMMFGPAMSGAKRVRALLQADELTDVFEEDTTPVPVGDSPTALECKNVSVIINGQKIIEDLSLTIRFSERTAIIGTVGGGKSMLLSLITGERAPTEGTISVRWRSGKTTSFWERSTYAAVRGLYAVSEQSPFLSSSRLRDNIDLSSSHSDEALLTAVREAQLEPDIASFPNGLNEEVGEIGVNLSGGQKQRVSLARAFISKRPFFVLDDPLSAVDSQTEAQLFNTVIGKGQGCLLVSHRLDELFRCDRLLVIEGGKIIEDGAPSVLLAQKDTAFFRYLEREEQV